MRDIRNVLNNKNKITIRLSLKVIPRRLSSSGGYHHHIGLNTWHSKGGSPAPKSSPGLFHAAILYPTRKDLAEVVQQLIDQNYPINGASDHGVSEAIYLDRNGVELYRDRSKEEWEYDTSSSVKMVTKPLNPQDLLNELE